MTTKTRLFSIVGRHWHRIAGALVIFIGLAEFVVGGLTADSGLELYIFAWATVTGSLWFVFEKAETAISDEARERLSHALKEADLRTVFQSIPHQFAALFDKIFGEKHLSRRCFYLSALVSIISSYVVLFVLLAFDAGGWSTGRTMLPPWVDPEATYRGYIEWHGGTSSLGFPIWSFWIYAVVLNVLPDYLSLLETRWAIRWMEKGKGLTKMIGIDSVATAAISILAIWLIVAVNDSPKTLNLIDVVRGRSYVSPFFYTAFSTSVWLWLYGAAVLFSRLLVKLNDGVGFLLNLTDMEQQPLRALGFVSILLVSAVFLVFLPAVVF